MFVHVLGPNLPDQSRGEFHVHARGCADITRNRDYRSAEFDYDRSTAVEVETLDDIVDYAYADQIDEESMTLVQGRSSIYLFGCVGSLPVEASATHA